MVHVPHREAKAHVEGRDAPSSEEARGSVLERRDEEQRAYAFKVQHTLTEEPYHWAAREENEMSFRVTVRNTAISKRGAPKTEDQVAKGAPEETQIKCVVGGITSWVSTR